MTRDGILIGCKSPAVALDGSDYDINRFVFTKRQAIFRLEFLVSGASVLDHERAEGVNVLQLLQICWPRAYQNGPGLILALKFEILNITSTANLELTKVRVYIERLIYLAPSAQRNPAEAPLTMT